MKRVAKMTSKHVEQIKKDYDKAQAMHYKICALQQKLETLAESYRWMSYTDGTVTENLSDNDNMNVSEYLQYIKKFRH